MAFSRPEYLATMDSLSLFALFFLMATTALANRAKTPRGLLLCPPPWASHSQIIQEGREEGGAGAATKSKMKAATLFALVFNIRGEETAVPAKTSL